MNESADFSNFIQDVTKTAKFLWISSC